MPAVVWTPQALAALERHRRFLAETDPNFVIIKKLAIDYQLSIINCQMKEEGRRKREKVGEG